MWNAEENAYQTTAQPELLRSVSDRVLREQYLSMPDALRREARARLRDNAERYPRSAAARAWRVGLYRES